MDDLQHDMAYDDSVSTKPVAIPAWRGRFNIPKRDIDINVAAHISNRACMKVWDVARTMPEILSLEMIPRIDVWPGSFKSSLPNEQSIGLFFLSEGRDEEVFDSVLNDAIYKDLALKANIGKSELLIFTSLQLPEKLHRFRGKFYMWGVFRGQDSHLDTPGQETKTEECGFSRPKMHVGPFPGMSPLIKEDTPEWAKHSTVSMQPATRGAMYEWVKNSTSSKTKRKNEEVIEEGDNRGRTLDNAWEHAKPLDTARQKTQCNFCDFISTYGGISRLKAHLSGGFHQQLKGCPKVSPEVKRVMKMWFNEWAQNSKAIWIRNLKREMPLDDTLQHAIPLDETGKRLKCKYCDFVSKHGDITRFKAHLCGGDPTSGVQGCPNASAKVKSLMAQGISNCCEKLKGENMEIARDVLQEADNRGRRLDDAWTHAKPIDEARQKTQCNYCGFVSKYGGISRLKAHLGGGHPRLQLQGCTKVSPQVKSLMEEWFKEWAQNSKAIWLKKYPHGKLKRGRPLDDTRDHATPLDEIRESKTIPDGITNTSLKDSLRKSINEKNSEMQIMQFEVQYPKSHLASMP